MKDHLTLLLEQVASQENTLLKTAAPNLRAQENLKAVRDKFQESADGKIEFIVVSNICLDVLFLYVPAASLNCTFILLYIFLCCLILIGV